MVGSLYPFSFTLMNKGPYLAFRYMTDENDTHQMDEIMAYIMDKTLKDQVDQEECCWLYISLLQVDQGKLHEYDDGTPVMTPSCKKMTSRLLYFDIKVCISTILLMMCLLYTIGRQRTKDSGSA